MPPLQLFIAQALAIFIKLFQFPNNKKLDNKVFESLFLLLWLLYYQISLQNLIQITSHLCHD